MTRDRLGQRASPQHPSRTSQGPPDRHQKQIRVSTRVRDRSRAMLVNQVAASLENFGRNVAFDLLDNQCADDLATVRVVAIDLTGRSGVEVRAEPSLRLAKRQHRNVSTVRLVDVVFQRFFDLRRQILRRSVVPQRFARGHDSCGQIVQCGNDVGTILDRVLAADRLHFALAAFFDRHTDSVTANQTSTVVGDDVCRFF